MRWSNNTFGTGPRFKGNMEHIRRELAEIEANPSDPIEYADVVILTFDTAMRQGITPHQLCKALEEKQLINFGREWNIIGDDEPAEHKRTGCGFTYPHEYYNSGSNIVCRLCGELNPSFQELFNLGKGWIR
jgi:hypothetical protein